MRNEIFVDFTWILNVITRRIWLIICLLILAVAAAVLIAIKLPPMYRATATLMIEPSQSKTTNELNVLMAGERLALTYSHIINSRPVLEKAITELNSKITVSELADQTSIQPINNTQLIQLSVTNPSSDQAIILANSIARSFLTYIKSLATENNNQGLDNNQKSIDLKLSEINSIISSITAQNKLKADLEAQLFNLQLQQSQKKDDYQLLQQNTQSIEMTEFENSKMIYQVEPAYISSIGPQASYVATLLIFFNKDIIITGNPEVTTKISDQIIQVYGPMLARDSLLSNVITKLSLNETPATLSKRISYEPVNNTQFLRLNVKGDEPNQAILIANTIADFFIVQRQSVLTKPISNKLSSLKSQMDEAINQLSKIQDDINKNSANAIPINLEIERLESELASKYVDLRDLQTNRDELSLQAVSDANAIVLTEPAANAKNLIQNNFIYAGLFLFLAMIACVGFVFLIENLDDKIRTQADILAILDTKPIGMISHINKSSDKLILESNSSPYISEEFRKLSAVIRPVMKDLPMKTLLITSPQPSEGKSLVASNLGLVFAKTGSQVIIVDADLHRPRQHAIFDVDFKEGLSDCLSPNFINPQHETQKHTATEGHILYRLKATKSPNLRLLTSGLMPDEPAELLSTPYLEKVLINLSDMADLVIVDCPPIVTLADASFITPFIDGVLLVIRSGVTKRKAVVDAMTILKNVEIKFLGIVLNDVVVQQDSLYHHYFDAKLVKKVK
jgi:capsular exopolysaccharide synthesis family protein